MISGWMGRYGRSHTKSVNPKRIVKGMCIKFSFGIVMLCVDTY